MVNYKLVTAFVLMLILAPAMASATTVTDQLIHHYKFENNTLDDQGLFDMLISGGYSFDAVEFREGAYSVNVDATVNMINTSSHFLTGGNNPITITGWAEQNDVNSSTFDYLVTIGNTPGTGSVMGISAVNQTSTDFIGIANDYRFHHDARQSNVWYHYAMVYDGFQNVSFYIDGALIETAPLSNPMNIASNQITIGQANNGAEKWEGNIDDIRFYDRALNSSEVQTIYNEAFASCSENWVCVGYANATCLINDTSTAMCNAVNDTNACGTNYTGDYTEFANQTGVCDYCTPDFASECSVWNTSACAGNLTNNYTCLATVDSNGCFALTGLPSDEPDLYALYGERTCNELQNENALGVASLAIAFIPLLLFGLLLTRIPATKEFMSSPIGNGSWSPNKILITIVGVIIVIALFGVLI